MFGLGVGELLVILVLALVIFGAGKLGDVGGDLGRAIRNFRKSVNEPDAIDVTPREQEEEAKGDQADEGRAAPRSGEARKAAGADEPRS